MKRIISITVKSFLAGFFLYLISDQVNSGNYGGTILGLALIVVLFYNIYLKEEYNALKHKLKEVRPMVEWYWWFWDIYE